MNKCNLPKHKFCPFQYAFPDLDDSEYECSCDGPLKLMSEDCKVSFGKTIVYGVKEANNEF